MKRDFSQWFSKLHSNIANYNFYTNFPKVFANVDVIKVELNILNSLIGSRNIENDFARIIQQYPETLKCIPILLAVRSREIYALDQDGEYNYDFTKMNYPVEQYQVFMRKTGLFDLMANHLVNNLVDYVTGVETGLDSHARKGRGGDQMEDLVETFIIKAGFVRDRTYFKEIYTREIATRWGLDLAALSNRGKTEKRLDFVIKTSKNVYGIETNFYSSPGSKLNETARSYKTLAVEAESIAGFEFIWITDGQGWKNARHNLEETFDVLDRLYNINDLESGVLKELP